MIKKTFYSLPEEKCERMNRTEMNAMRWCMAAINSIAYAQDDLAKRLECIPNGKARWRMMLGSLRACLNDLIGTLPRNQVLKIRNTMDDMELRMVPKFTPKTNRICLDVEEAEFLIDAAKRDICTSCILNGDECRKCRLYQILEGISPQENWADSTICPYNREDWYLK